MSSKIKLCKRMIFATPPFSQSEQARYILTRLQCCLQIQRKGLIYQLLTGLDFLHELIGTILRVHERPNTLTDGLKLIFLKVQKPKHHQRFSLFQWRWSTADHSRLIYNYEGHVFGAKIFQPAFTTL